MEHVALGLRLARGRAVVPDLKGIAMQVVQRIRLSALMILAIGLASCASVPGSAVLHPVDGPAGVGKPVDVLGATTRLRSEADGREFTAERNRGVSYAAYTVSIPPDHVAGEIEWPTTLPGNPATNFVVTGSQSLDKAGFSRTAMRDMKGSGEVIVFVHGYNTSYQAAVFRAAQLKHDNGLPEAVIAFAWPSKGSLVDYMTDREASTFSRDYLERTLDDLARTPGIRHINIIAHSMGSWLTMETLRQAKLRGNSTFLPKLGEVLLASPDIDLYVFGTQLDVIGKRNPPIMVAISEDDQALGLSQWLAGDVPRVGNVSTADNKAEWQREIAHYGLQVINMSDAKSRDAVNHGKFVGLIPALNQMVRAEARGRGSVLSRTGLFMAGPAGTALQMPLKVGEAIARR